MILTVSSKCYILPLLVALIVCQPLQIFRIISFEAYVAVKCYKPRLIYNLSTNRVMIMQHKTVFASMTKM